MAQPRLWIERSDVPQADSIKRLIAIVRHLDDGESIATISGFRHRRDLIYYRRAAKALRLLGPQDTVTPIGHKLTQACGPEALHVFSQALSESPVGLTWLAWQHVIVLAALDPKQTESFLEQCTDLSVETRQRRARTLRNWLGILFPMKRQSATPRTPVTSDAVHQLLLPMTDAGGRPLNVPWPDPLRFPHNEVGYAVEKILADDFCGSTSILVITGYASLDRVVRFLDQRDFAMQSRVRLMFGNEPYYSPGKSYPIGSKSLADEIRDYWLSHGFSIMLSGALMRVQQIVREQLVQVRIATRKRPVHAKIYCGDRAVTVGSSNYSERGLKSQSEGNVRFEREDIVRYSEGAQLAEGIWSSGEDYRTELLKLLERLFKPASWQEALARSCAALLEGAWAKKYLLQTGDSDAPELWPHQREGIAQALWILENVGSVLVADAAGSGKTRMGAWLLHATYLQQVRGGHSLRGAPVVVVPPQVRANWDEDLERAHLRLKVDSHGPLSHKNAVRHESLLKAVADTELLVLDEAHNYLNRSGRSRKILSHYADRTLLFTATPINRTARDLLGIIELLGADNLSESSIKTLRELRNFNRLPKAAKDRVTAGAVDKFKAEIEKFMVRRTRSDLRRMAAERREDYRLRDGRYAQYPEQTARYYRCDAGAADLELAGRIEKLASSLTGIGRIRGKLELPAALRWDGMNEEQYIRRVLKGSESLARHFVMDCLRSSCAALYEHAHGTEAAIKEFKLKSRRVQKGRTGAVIQKLRAQAGQLPMWRLKELKKSDVPPWLVDEEEHRKTCEEEAVVYEQIALLARRISDTRERTKLKKLTELADEQRLVIAFDSHVLTLELLSQRLEQDRYPVEIFTGASGDAGKRKAEQILGLHTKEQRCIALCSDILSEGMNLQGASCVVHLDTPTVIRTAEQRAGRIDRINSRHPAVEVWWPEDPPEFAPRKRDLLRERHSVVTRLIGANLMLPDKDEEESSQADDPLTGAQLVEQLLVKRAQSVEFFDAFRAVRELIEPGGLVPPDVYRQLRTSAAQILTRISIVHCERPWAFFVVTGAERTMPRWVLLKAPGAHPMVDLATIADELKERLRDNPPSLVLDKNAERWMHTFVERMQKTEWELLPARRYRALILADQVLDGYAKTAWGADPARLAVIIRAQQMLRPDRTAPYPDPRWLAEAWLSILRPLRAQLLSERRKRKWPWTITELKGYLLEKPLSMESISRLCDDVPLLPPIRERIVTMILGIPEHEEDAPEARGTTENNQ